MPSTLFAVVLALVTLALLLAVAFPLLRGNGRNVDEMSDQELPDLKKPRNESELL